MPTKGKAGFPVIAPSELPDYLPVIQDTEERTPLSDAVDTDEIQTMIDLATAYISMGDEEEAKETLKQAIKKSSGEIRTKAQRMLDALN